MSIRKTNILIYPIDKVIFPYHEYAFQISSNMYERTIYFYSQLKSMIISLVLLPRLTRPTLEANRLKRYKEYHAMEFCLKLINLRFLDIKQRKMGKFTNLIFTV